jgi:hypothetical protein
VVIAAAMDLVFACLFTHFFGKLAVAEKQAVGCDCIDEGL